MNYRVLKAQLLYEGCPIVIRQLGEMFEFIACINNEIYSSNIVATRSVFQKLLGKPHTEKEINAITNHMIYMAQATINSVLGIQPAEEETK